MLLSNFSKNIRDGGRWESDHSGEACFFLKSRAFGVCQTAQAKTLKNIRRSLKRSYSCVQQIIFQKLHNLQGCKTTLWSSSFCGRTMLQNNISMAKYCVVKTLKNLMIILVIDCNLIILFHIFNTIDRESMQLFEQIFTVVNF